MSLTGLASFDSTVHLTNAWLGEICDELGWGSDRGRAYQGLRAVLHALRDRLPMGEVADLSAQLPLLVRGIYFEGWRPTGAAEGGKDHTKEQLIEHVARELPPDLYGDAEDVTRAVFRVISRRVTGGEVEDIRNSMPSRLRELWD